MYKYTGKTSKTSKFNFSDDIKLNLKITDKDRLNASVIINHNSLWQPHLDYLRGPYMSDWGDEYSKYLLSRSRP